MRSTLVYAPDGMFGAGDVRERFKLEAVQAHERHDDGLVHNHDWAATRNSQAPATRSMSRPAKPVRFQDHRPTQEQDRYDDGLVHNHDWAVTGK
jgi:hypothetical protein